MYRTENCIICMGGGKKVTEATRWTGHVLKGKTAILAGFCENHKGTCCQNFGNKPGCFGNYKPEFKLISEDDFDRMINSVINSNKDGGF